MDPVIWRRLPTELVRKIVESSALTIDSRIAFKIPPKKIPESRAWKLWYLLNHDGVFYNIDTQTMHNFRVPGVHIVRRPVDVAWLDDDLAVFNLNQNEHTLEITTSGGAYLYSPGQKESIATELKVILKGGGVAPSIPIQQRVAQYS
jgi:hypothetical protein